VSDMACAGLYEASPPKVVCRCLPRAASMEQHFQNMQRGGEVFGFG
jgi:hypothetical protein